MNIENKSKRESTSSEEYWETTRKRFEKQLMEGGMEPLTVELKKELTELKIKDEELRIKFLEALGAERKRRDDKIISRIMEFPTDEPLEKTLHIIEEKKALLSNEEKFYEAFIKASKEVTKEEGWDEVEVIQKLHKKFSLSDREYERLKVLESDNQLAAASLSQQEAEKLAHINIKKLREGKESLSKKEKEEYDALMLKRTFTRELPLSNQEIYEFAQLKIKFEKFGDLSEFSEEEQNRFIELGKKLQSSVKNSK